MPVYKDDKTNTWYVKRRYRDWMGKTRDLMKRGFKRKRDATEWENDFLQRMAGELDTTFANFYEMYKRALGGRSKDSTWGTKEHIIEHHLLPYFGKMHMQEISSADVMRWQNSIMKCRTSKGKPFSQTYIKTIHNQLTAIFNHAVRHYRLGQNPARIAGAIGDKEGGEIQVWTQEEYKRFSEAIRDKPISFHCFEMLYWCGIREGELLALTFADFDFKKKEVTINKTFHRAKGEDVVTTPKTKQSVRKVSMPDFLAEEMQAYMAAQYRPEPGDRVFPVTKSYLLHEMTRGCQLSGVKRIRVHDIRHSHVSLLIDMGYNAVAIAKRVGHKSIDITFRYAHLFPSVQADMVKQLDQARLEGGDGNDE